MTRQPTRELARRAVQQEIADVAERLFLDRGYDRTTVDDIAAAVGISQRTFFRYFATKDETLFVRIDRSMEELLAGIDARPHDEAPWDTLRVVMHVAIERSATQDEHEWAERLRLITKDAPALIGAQLQRLDSLQIAAAERIVARIAERPTTLQATTIRALVGAAVAALTAVVRQGEADALPLSDRLALLDTVLEALRPGDRALG